MVGKYKVITLCGSTRFKDAFMEAQKQLTLEGNIVISVGLFGHSGWMTCTSEKSTWRTRSLSSMSVGILVPALGRRLSMQRRPESR